MHGQEQGRGLLSVLTTNLLFTFSRICFSFSAMASPFRFLIRFFSSFLHAYILPVARTWQAHTWSQSRWANRDQLCPFWGYRTSEKGCWSRAHCTPPPLSIRGSGLATHLTKAAFAQDSVLPEGVFGHWLPVGKGFQSKHWLSRGPRPVRVPVT